VTDVLADAETRSSLQGAAGAGYNGGFFLSSADGNYSMKINLLQQMRWTFNDQSDANDEQNSGFTNNRTRLSFSGNMGDSSWSYKIAYYLGIANEGAGTPDNYNGQSLADASVAKDFGNGVSLTVGQFKLPFSAEYGLDAGNLQFNDYSVVNTNMGTGYGQGLMLGYSADAIRAGVAYINAIDSANAAWGVPTNDWAFSLRGEYKLSGDWAQFNDAQSWKGEGYAGMIGFGYASQNFSDDLVGRYENFDIDGGDEISTFTVGGNYYMAKNTAKLGVELGFALDPLPVDATYANWLASSEDGEWVLRGQMSFSF
jgi:hypothetical protein